MNPLIPIGRTHVKEFAFFAVMWILGVGYFLTSGILAIPPSTTQVLIFSLAGPVALLSITWPLRVGKWLLGR